MDMDVSKHYSLARLCSEHNQKKAYYRRHPVERFHALWRIGYYGNDYKEWRGRR